MFGVLGVKVWGASSAKYILMTMPYRASSGSYEAKARVNGEDIQAFRQPR